MVMLVCGLVGVRAWGVAYFQGAGGWHISRVLGGCHGAVAGLYTGKLEVMTNYY